MLSDITVLTKKVFDVALDDNKSLSSAKVVYSVYGSLSSLISNAELVANHYLALDFTESFLQNSSWGEPVDKWRYFFNKDLEYLNTSSKKYLHLLSSLGIKEELVGIMSNHYNCKTYYGFVRDKYNAGFIEPCGTMLYITALNTNISVEERTYLGNFHKINLSTYVSRKILQQELYERIMLLKLELQKIKVYMQSRYTLDDLI